MFEKYHLVHFEIRRPLTENSEERIYTADENNRSATGSNIKWSEFTNDSNGAHCSSYCLTGNFDILTSVIPFENSTESLHLQSFCIMNTTAGYYTCRSDYESLLLSYTYSGEGHLLYNGESFSAKEGQIFIIDCRKPHEYFTAEDHWEHADIHMWGSMADSLYRHFSDQNIVLMSYPLSDFHVLVERLLDSCITISDHRNLFISNALTNMLCSLLENAEKEDNSAIPDTYKYVIHYMECNYMNPLSLASLSSFANISKYHFAREFKKYTGYAPNDYLLELRVKHACILLANSDLSIEQISNEVGIHNMSNFINHFKKRTGLTPSSYRNINQADSKLLHVKKFK